MRFLKASLCLMALTLAVGAADDKPADGEKPSPKEQFAALQKEFAKQRTELITKVRAAKEPEQQELFQKGMAEIGTSFIPKFLAFAKANGKDKAGFDALMFVTQMAKPDSKEAGEAADLMASGDHTERVAQMADRLANMGATGERVMRAAMAKTEDAKLRTKLTLGVAKAIKDQVDDGVIKDKEAATKMAEAEKLLDTVAASSDEKSAEDAKGVLYELRNLAIGKPLPELDGKDLDGKAVKASDFKGKVVVFDVWATWCGPCRAMIPHERELVKRLEGKPFAFVSISCDKEKEKLTDFLKETEMPWTHWHDGQSGVIGKALRIQHYPTIYVVDAKGIIRYKEVRGPKMDEAVDTLLKEVGK